MVNKKYFQLFKNGINLIGIIIIKLNKYKLNLPLINYYILNFDLKYYNLIIYDKLTKIIHSQFDNLTMKYKCKSHLQ